MIRYTLALLLLLSMVCLASARQVQFNYNGRINAAGTPVEGVGYFKLSLTNADGTVTYWANDGITLDGNEPTTAITVTVTNGFFSIDVGDTSIEGMAPLNAALFNSGDDVYLRTWFNDGASGFQQLLPDKKVVNPALLGLFNTTENNVIYVDPINGNDNHSGLTTETAKLTIQAAWNSVPPLVRHNITLQLLNGVYRESVELNGKTAIGQTSIILRGNPSNPGLVYITGANTTDETTAVRINGIKISNQRDLYIDGISVGRYTYAGIFVDDGSKLHLRNSIIREHPNLGIYVTNLSRLDMRETELFGAIKAPLWIDMNSNAEIFNVSVHNSEGALTVAHAGCLNIWNSSFYNMNVAVLGHANAMISYGGGQTSLTRFENCNIGTRVMNNSTVLNSNICTYVNTPTRVQLGPGSPVSN